MQIDFATLSFTKTRARTNDPSTSHAAAKHAATGRAAQQRLAIVAALNRYGPMTDPEIASFSGVSYHDVARRRKECGAVATGMVKNGRNVWGMPRAVDVPTGEFHFLDEADKHRLQLERKSVK